MSDTAATRLLADVREMLAEQREHRELLFRFVARDLLVRYKQTVMGVGWAIFMPIVNTIVFTIIFTRVAHVDAGMPYSVFAFSGLLPWNFFASSLRLAVTSLTSNATLITKVYFPREIFPFSTLVVCLVDFTIGFLILAAMLAYHRIGPFTTMLLLPVVVAVQIAFTAGAALILSMGHLFYRDVKYVFEVVITVWMFATSVVYPVDRIGGRLGQIMKLNPMTPIIDAYRAILLRGEWPPAQPFLAAAAVSVALFALAWIVFHRCEFTFAEHI